MQRYRKNVSEGKMNVENLAHADLFTDDADVVDGMPLSLQLVAQRLEEEKVIAMTRVVLQAL